ncbi:hypothetical protein HMPREF1640_00835 [Prevotella sp. S7-1-8]|nr:hypothetical protein HMPREF1640_00835 [Prevotella sp. S7-1-8]
MREFSNKTIVGRRVAEPRAPRAENISASFLVSFVANGYLCACREPWASTVWRRCSNASPNNV